MRMSVFIQCLVLVVAYVCRTRTFGHRDASDKGCTFVSFLLVCKGKRRVNDTKHDFNTHVPAERAYFCVDVSICDSDETTKGRIR